MGIARRALSEVRRTLCRGGNSGEVEVCLSRILTRVRSSFFVVFSLSIFLGNHHKINVLRSRPTYLLIFSSSIERLGSLHLQCKGGLFYVFLSGLLYIVHELSYFDTTFTSIPTIDAHLSFNDKITVSFDFFG